MMVCEFAGRTWAPWLTCMLRLLSFQIVSQCNLLLINKIANFFGKYFHSPHISKLSFWLQCMLVRFFFIHHLLLQVCIYIYIGISNLLKYLISRKKIVLEVTNSFPTDVLKWGGESGELSLCPAVTFLPGCTASPSSCSNDSWHVLPVGQLLRRKLEGMFKV